jgi:hypothetical protein
MDAQSIIEMKNQTAEFNTVAEEMKQAMMSLAISLGPVVTILKMLLDGLQLLLTPIRWIGEGIEYMSDALDGMGTSGTTALNILKMLGAAAVAVGITMALVSAPLWGTYAAIAAIVTAMGAFVKGVTVGFSPSLLDTLDMSAIGFGTLSVEAGLASTELDAVTASTKQVATQGAPAARATAATTQLMNTTRHSNSTINNISSGGGSPAPINLNLSLVIDGDEIKNVVNKIKVDPARNPNLHNSIVKLVSSGQER